MSKLEIIQSVAAVLHRSPVQLRQDAAYDTAFLARELTQIEAEAYRVEYADVEFRQHLPVKNSGLNAAAKYFVYKVWDFFGMAKWIADYADDLPNVALRAKEEVSYAASLGDSYQFSAMELMQAAMAGVPLEREEARAAFEFIERKMDHAAAFGESALRLKGALNHSDPAVQSPAANGGENGGGGTSTQFRHKTPAEILRDLHGFAQTMVDRNKKKFIPDTMIFPPTVHGLIATMPVSDLQPETTVLSVFLKTSPYIRNIETWDLLETAGEDGGPRIVVWKKDPRVGQVYIPMEAKAEAPQNRNLAVVINVWARFGGFVLRQPLGMDYVDGAGFIPS